MNTLLRTGPDSPVQPICRSVIRRRANIVVWLAVLLLPYVAMTFPPAGAAAREDAFSAYKRLLETVQPTHPQLLQSLDALLHKTDWAANARSGLPFMLLSFYDREGRIEDLVVQIFQDTGSPSGLSNPGGVMNTRLGDANYQSTDLLLQAVHQPSVFLGTKEAADRQRRAFEASLAGDLTFLREMTVEPLRVIALVPVASKFLPSSLGERVESVVIDGKLSFGEWQTQAHFIARDAATAEQVGFVVSGWRELAVYLTDTFAAHGAGRQLRQALQNSSVQVINNRVVGSTTLPAAVAVRAAKEASGHGGGCPPGGTCDPNQVAICHHPGKNGHTRCVNPNSVAAHLAHGDHCGPCLAAEAPGRSDEKDPKDK